ncbi:hypothetical protein ACFRAA_32745 [[Kitasatospora] papulosa]|uniref:hypothetical protein n=1 Tax=[Kitasatospora] papulosa TaxID=1464011 RepID=UPI003643B9C6
MSDEQAINGERPEESLDGHECDYARVETVRSLAGLIAVLAGDAAIALAVVLSFGHLDKSQGMSVLTAGLTSITAITTAYFGIKAASNTADRAIRKKRHKHGGKRHTNSAGRHTHHAEGPTTPPSA